MWDLPGPGLEPVSPALAGGFLTTAPSGKSQSSDFKATISQTFSNKLAFYEYRSSAMEAEEIRHATYSKACSPDGGEERIGGADSSRCAVSSPGRLVWPVLFPCLLLH